MKEQQNLRLSGASPEDLRGNSAFGVEGTLTIPGARREIFVSENSTRRSMPSFEPSPEVMGTFGRKYRLWAETRDRDSRWPRFGSGVHPAPSVQNKYADSLLNRYGFMVIRFFRVLCGISNFTTGGSEYLSLS